MRPLLQRALHVILAGLVCVACKPRSLPVNQEMAAPDVAGDVGDGSIGSDGGVWPLPAVCAATSLPEPGQACDKEGSVRCTNWQGSVSKDDGQCVRPHRVVCSRSSSTVLVWELQACGPVPSECDYYKSVTMGCQETSRGATCCPTRMVVTNNQNALYPDYVKRCHDEGMLLCKGEASGSLSTCDFPDTGPVHPYTKQETEKAFGTCLTLCKDCLYIVAKEHCPYIQVQSCNNERNTGMISKQFCLTNIPGKGPTCAQDCNDFKYSTWSKRKP